ncbi:hypothetical protein J7W19_27375 [Streptomyces mobaraensis NBRC 13819 = DSM 40847]|uniref:Uncharacterized protein n=1 Tax=Streptomyces mobaraensis (strain ATCC 29032 / DSM 40847 / JCM 4168 / NBRC 13819 / NCIMB 11159 / IPCR 16-22) TaxID=1223523 RepID=M3CB19_STRM1|nr:hypothetical protein [Streptomyces mobaraensis]EMF01252.1 hypothetical protein H340_07346 [Streptomyces mobaraensis NBRC 13819 = DSM 40847]QTT76604.1 hypothetical protein J7W19_27375 [Streptomyces mobaraensis NBRC 13819 = DSM 40847]
MNGHTLFLAVTDRTGRTEPTPGAEPAFALTTLAVDTGRLEEAEHRAADALAGLAPGADWIGLPPSVRRQVVERVRAVPHYAVDHTEHDRDPARSASPLADCLNSLATGGALAEITGRPYTVYLTGGLLLGEAASAPLLAGARAVHPDAEARFPALARLTALLATAAAPSADAAVVDEEDLYDAFDRYTLGGLA